MSEYDENDGFEGYQEISVDPGPSVLIATIIFSFVLLLIIPFLTWAGEKRKRRRLAEQENQHGQSIHSAIPQNEGRRSVQNIDDDEASVKSMKSTVSSVAQAVMNAILDSHGRAATPLRARVEKREHLLNEEEQRMVAVRKNSIGGTPKTADDDDISITDSVAEGSVLSRLDHDEVSVRDAVDAQEGAIEAARICAPKNLADDDELIPFWRPAAWPKIFDSLLAIAEYDYEMRRIVKLATPFVLEALGQGLLEAVNVALIGHLIGTRHMAAYVTVDMLVGLTGSFLAGFKEALTTVCSQAIGARNKKLAGQYVQLSIIMYLVTFSPFAVLWIYCMGDVLAWFGFDEETVSIGSDFVKIFVFAYIVHEVSGTLHALLDTIDKESYSTFFTLSQKATESLGIFIIGIGKNPSLDAVGLVLLLIQATGVFVNVIIILWRGWFDPFLEGMVGSFAFYNWRAVKVLCKTSLPLCFGSLLAYGEWEMMTFYAKFLGPAEVAAWSLLGTLWDVVEMVTESVADSAEVRVAMLLGAGRPEKAKISAYKTIYLGVFISLFLSSCLFVMGDNIPIWMTTDATLQRMLVELIPLFGVGNIALTLGTIAWTSVGAQGRWRLSTAVGFSGAWFISIPLAGILTVALKIDLQGQTAAMVLGYMASGAANAYILFTSDWETLSKQVMEEQRDCSESYSSSSGSSSDSDESSHHESPLEEKVAELVRDFPIDDDIQAGTGAMSGLSVRIQK